MKLFIVSCSCTPKLSPKGFLLIHVIADQQAVKNEKSHRKGRGDRLTILY